jgi:hypothetical protein
MNNLNIGKNTPDPRRNQGPGGGQPNFSQEELEDMDTLTCNNCGGETFNSALQFKEIPSVHPASPPGDSAIQPVQVFACVGCGQSVNNQLQ